MLEEVGWPKSWIKQWCSLRTKHQQITNMWLPAYCFSLFPSLFVTETVAQQHTSVYLGRICSGKFTCCHTVIEAGDQTFYLTHSQCRPTGTRPTSPSADPVMPGAWQGGYLSAIFHNTGMTRPGKIPMAPVGIEPRIFRSRVGRLNQ